MQNDKSLFSGELPDRLTEDFTVIGTNWSLAAQAYMKVHIVVAIDTAPNLVRGAEDIRTAHLAAYGGTVAVALNRGPIAWASQTVFYYYAHYRGVFIGIWSSN